MKMPKASRALLACVAYDHNLRLISDLTRRIGYKLGACRRGSMPENFAQQADDPKQGTTHLAEAYTPLVHDDGRFSPVRVWHEEDAQKAIMADCPHCLEAHALIQERKATRKRLGVVKRLIRSIGRP